MRASKIDALIAFVDARIEARMVLHSCGPHIAAIKDKSRSAEQALRAAFKEKPDA